MQMSFKRFFVPIFFVYKWSYEEAKILHRDLSVTNIVCRRTGDGAVRGFLIDFDLASQRDIHHSMDRHQRTSTLPFMAIDISAQSPSPIRLYRHDLESLYYIIASVVCDFNYAWIRDFFSLRGHHLVSCKRAHFFGPCLPPREGFELFTAWLRPLHRAFQLGFRDQSDHNMGVLGKDYDDTTLGGHVTFVAFENIFK
ncbi:hypothetical protein DL96DRAFT_599267 [Flagelloscypha sp. PMI_526]|nr:hypothetical protein DL96DRAFT_599267 [Flagelloscypha sp. PMI_526]